VMALVATDLRTFGVLLREVISEAGGESGERERAGVDPLALFPGFRLTDPLAPESDAYKYIDGRFYPTDVTESLKLTCGAQVTVAV
ncbi:hypothetical protein KIPB_013357, partial [Kipferlia bialata]